MVKQHTLIAAAPVAPSLIVVVDGWKSQSIYAKPILDKYGFKASFLIPYTKMQTYPKWLTWQQITGLKNDGMDIESHTMTHAHLPDLLSSPARLTYEIGCAKQCLSNHGFDTTIFGYPLNSGFDNPTIVNLVAKYYSFARSGSDPLMFLNCKDCHGMASTITVPLFAQEMQYLHDNGFKVLTLSQRQTMYSI